MSYSIDSGDGNWTDERNGVAVDPMMFIERGVRRVASTAARNAQHFLVGFIALSLVVLTGFARASADTDPTALASADAATNVDDSFATLDGAITVTIVGERTLLSGPIVAAISSLHSGIAAVEGVVGDQVVSIKSGSAGVQPATRQEINDFADAIASDSVLAGVALSPDRSVATILVPLEANVSATSVSAAIEALISDTNDLAGVNLHVTSFAIAEERVADHLLGQVLVRVIIGWLLGFAALLVVFRQPALAAIGSVLVAASVVWTMALTALFGAEISAVGALIPAAALVAAIVHLVRPVTAYYSHVNVLDAPEDAIETVTVEAAKASFIADAAIVAAFVALAIAEQQFRTYSLSIATGFIVAWLISVVVLPAALASLDAKFLAAPAERNVDDGPLATVSRWVPTVGVRARGTLLGAIGIALGFGVVGIAYAALDDNPLRWLRGSTDEALAVEAAEQTGIGATSALLTLEADVTHQLTALGTLDAIASLQTAWAVDPAIGPSMSYASLVGDGDAADRRTAFDRLAATHPHGALVAGTDGRSAAIRVWLRDGDADATRHLMNVTELELANTPLNPGIEIAWSGEALDNIAWQDNVVRGPARMTTVAAIVGALAALAMLGSVKWAAVALAPAAVTFVTVFGAIGWRDEVHGLPSAVGGLLLVAFAAEVGIVAVFHYRRFDVRTWSPTEAAAELGSGPARGMIVAGAVAFVSMIPLAMADLLPNGRGGFFVLVGAGFGALLALALVPASASGPPKNTAPLEVRGASPA